MLTPANIPSDPPADWRPNTKLLYMTASQNGWTHAQVKDLILANFGRASTKDLQWHEYNRVLDWLGKLPPGTISAERDPFTKDLFE